MHAATGRVEKENAPLSFEFRSFDILDSEVALEMIKPRQFYLALFFFRNSNSSYSPFIGITKTN